MKSKAVTLSRDVRKNYMLFLMVLPVLVYFIIFAYVPMAGLTLAFRDFRFDMGMFGSPWVGLENFRVFFASGRAGILIRNTMLYNLAFIVTGVIFQVGLAVLISEIRNRYFKKIAHSVIFLPYFISWVAVAFMAYNLLNTNFGVINTALRGLGMEPFSFYGTPGVWRYLLVIFNNWKWLGYGSVVYLAVITGISLEYYEAAQVDGANVLQRIRYITLPSLKPTIIIMVLLSLGNILRAVGGGEMFYQLVGQNVLLFNETDVIDVFILRQLINPLSRVNFGVLTAVSLFQQVCGFILIMTVNTSIRRMQPDYALF